MKLQQATQTHAEADHQSKAASVPSAALSAAVLLSLSACGGGGADTEDYSEELIESKENISQKKSSFSESPQITEQEASRFLIQASVGHGLADIREVQQKGFATWIDEQLQMGPTSRWDWLNANGYNVPLNRGGYAKFFDVAWSTLAEEKNVLRQKMTVALSEILVINVEETGFAWKTYGGASYLDLLDRHAFGNLRSLLSAVCRSLHMAHYLTFINSSKPNPKRGTSPDENFARELLQLFTIGIVQLNPDGTKKSTDGVTSETYSQEDIVSLAKVFTGWRPPAAINNRFPDFWRLPLSNKRNLYDPTEKNFLGGSIAQGVQAEEALEKALDIIYAHPNIPPFWSKFLIQRFVTSNPSNQYVERISKVFENDGFGKRGNLGSIIKAILMDEEARSPQSLSNPDFGKLREPIFRMTSWIRGFAAQSQSGKWLIGETSNEVTHLGQSILHSPTVFNFFRPGFVLPKSHAASRGMTSPEFQLVNENSVTGYVNFMTRVIGNKILDVQSSYTDLSAMASNPIEVVDRINLIACAGRLPQETIVKILAAIASMPIATNLQRLYRVKAALLMVYASPEFLIQK